MKLYLFRHSEEHTESWQAKKLAVPLQVGKSCQQPPLLLCNKQCRRWTTLCCKMGISPKPCCWQAYTWQCPIQWVCPWWPLKWTKRMARAWYVQQCTCIFSTCNTIYIDFSHTLYFLLLQFYLFSGSKAVKELEMVVKNKRLLKDIPQLSPHDQTASIESYHKVVCFFAPKMYHFFHAAMHAR